MTGASSADAPRSSRDDVGATSRPADSWLAAVDRYGEVAKWLIAAFGGIGAVIVGTAPLARLTSTPPDRLGFVVAGAAVAFIGVTAVLTAAVAALVPRAVHRHQLQARKRGRFRRTFIGLGNLDHLLAEHPGDVLPPGVATIDQLDEAIANLRNSAAAVASGAKALADDDPARPRQERTALALEAALVVHQQARQRLLAVARYETGRTRFNVSLVAVLGGGALTAVGLGLTLYGLGTGDTASEPPAAVHADPVPVVVSLTPDGTTTLGPRLGDDCDLGRIDALVVTGDRASGPWEVVTLPTRQCRPLRFTLTANLGTIS